MFAMALTSDELAAFDHVLCISRRLAPPSSRRRYLPPNAALPTSVVDVGPTPTPPTPVPPTPVPSGCSSTSTIEFKSSAIGEWIKWLGLVGNTVEPKDFAISRLHHSFFSRAVDARTIILCGDPTLTSSPVRSCEAVFLVGLV